MRKILNSDVLSLYDSITPKNLQARQKAIKVIIKLSETFNNIDWEDWDKERKIQMVMKSIKRRSSERFSSSALDDLRNDVFLQQKKRTTKKFFGL